MPYAVGTPLPNNGLPVFTVPFENDDDAQRKLGKDSRLTFVAPATGQYLVRVSDVRGFAGADFKYELTIRRPQPDFKVTLTGNNPTINAGSGKPFTVKAERTDNFVGPIRVDISGLPAGFQATSPLVIPAGLYEAQGVINALPNVPKPPEKDQQPTKVTATAVVFGQERTKEVNNLGTLKLAEKPKVLVHLELPTPLSNPAAGTKPGPGSSASTPSPASPEAGLPPAVEKRMSFPPPQEITIAPGGTVTSKLRIERNGFDDRVPFEIANLPHGIIVDDIGLSGILVREKETERLFVLRAEPWVPEQSRLFHATAQVEGNQVSLPMVIRVKRN